MNGGIQASVRPFPCGSIVKMASASPGLAGLDDFTALLKTSQFCFVLFF